MNKKEKFLRAMSHLIALGTWVDVCSMDINRFGVMGEDYLVLASSMAIIVNISKPSAIKTNHT